MTEMWVYKDAGFQGGRYYKDFDDANLWGGGLDNEISSIKIRGGCVDFYEHRDKLGAKWTLCEGDYDTGDLLASGIPNDTISSFWMS